MKRFGPALRYLFFLGLATAMLLLGFEGVLRLVFGLPRGMYDYRPVDNTSLYLPNKTLHMVWAPIPYTIKTNSLGFRGPEITLEKPPGVFRIIALGDSITDGFYVENENTYPFLLEQTLREQGRRIEVINAARGWSAIDVEFEMLRKFCMPLHPDLVVLTFVSNDMEEIRGKSREELLKSDAFEPEPAETSEWLMFAKTATGELLLDLSLRYKFEKYRRNREMLSSHEMESRYQIPGGTNFLDNAHYYLEGITKKTQGIAYFETFNENQLRNVGNYVFCLGELNRYCAEHGVRLVLAYYPDYPEIYLPERRFPMSGYLEKACEEQHIPFVNLLGAFRRHSGEVLHLAPLDFHPNPAGNKVIADAIADFLNNQALLPPAEPPSK